MDDGSDAGGESRAEAPLQRAPVQESRQRIGERDLHKAERLDVDRLARELAAQGKAARAHDSIDSILAYLTEHAANGNAIALLSNGAFGGIHRRLLDALS